MLRLRGATSRRILGLLSGRPCSANWTRLGRGNISRRRLSLEELEVRTLLAVSLAPIGDITVPAGKTFQLPVDGAATGPDAGNPIVFEVTSDNPNVAVSVTPASNRSLEISTEIDGAPQEDMIFQLFDDLTPNTVDAIMDLVNQGFYTDRIFHRIIPDFVAQFGNAQDGSFPTDLPTIDDEFNAQLTFVGFAQLAMAKTPPDDTGTGQVFITDVDLSVGGIEPPQHLNFEHTIFGQMTQGFDTLANIIAVGTPGGTPTSQVVITGMSVLQDVEEDIENAVVRVTAANGFTGQATVTVDASTQAGGSTQSVVNVTVVPDTLGGLPLNDRPFLGPVGDQVTDEDTPLPFQLTATDLENDQLTFVVRDPDNFASPPANVQVDIDQATGQVTLTPAQDFNGDIELLVGVRDQEARARDNLGQLLPLDDVLNFDTQRISLTVNPVREAPTAFAQNVVLQPGMPSSIQLEAEDGDPDQDLTLTFEIVTPPANGQLTNFDPATGTVDYTPNPGFAGADRFIFQVQQDGGETSAPSPVRLIGPQSPGRAVLRNGVLRVVGDGRGNDLRVRPFPENSEVIDAVIDGIVAGSFNRADVSGVVARGLGGGDRISLSQTLSLPASLLGGSGNDTIIGAGGDDRLVGHSGRDVLRGGAGNNALFGGSGEDLAVGGPGNDRAVGGAAADILRGNGGDDILNGNDGRDVISGGAGRDSIAGGPGNDTLAGGPDSDLLLGGTGNDRLLGGQGDDLLNGDGNGNDFLDGGPGDDVLTRKRGDDTLRGGPGSDVFGPVDLVGRSDFSPDTDVNSRGRVTPGSFTDPGLLGEPTDQRPGAPPPTQGIHIPEPEAIDYSTFSNPPTYGPHRPFEPGDTPRPTGYYDTEQPDAKLIHNLEHGHVWISYRRDLIDPVDLGKLKVIGETYGLGTGVIITPRAANDTAIAMASWTHLLTMDSFELETIVDFILANRGHSPEGFATPANNISDAEEPHP